MIKIKRGLNLPIVGSPEQRIEEGPQARSAALVGLDYVGMKPTMAVQVGDRVKTGQLVFEDKKTPGIRYTAPASGVISAINRGEKRVLLSVVIDIDSDDHTNFARYDRLTALTRSQVVDNLVNSGLWTALRTRPFSKVPTSDSVPHSLFVTAMDTHPLAADPTVIISQYADVFAQGLTVLAKLTNKLFVCAAHDASLPNQAIPSDVDNVSIEHFSGPHPAGLPGTHIHALDPVSIHKTVWTMGYQDVIAVGKLFTTGQLFTERTVALAGPQAIQPRLITTRLGAHLEELTAGQLKPGENRLISGSVLGGRTAMGALAYLGRYHNQISVLQEGRKREFMGWFSPGLHKHSALNIYLSRFFPKKTMALTTTTNGSERAMVPMGTYENVMPMDILPTQLLRALIVGDTQTAQQLGCLELDEEDLALCTYVCPGKYEYGPILRDNLTRIEQEG